MYDHIMPLVILTDIRNHYTTALQFITDAPRNVNPKPKYKIF